MPPSLSELKVTPSFCFAFKFPDDPTATKIHTPSTRRHPENSRIRSFCHCWFDGKNLHTSIYNFDEISSRDNPSLKTLLKYKIYLTIDLPHFHKLKIWQRDPQPNFQNVSSGLGCWAFRAVRENVFNFAKVFYFWGGFFCIFWAK